jgi:hypothetical protein
MTDKFIKAVRLDNGNGWIALGEKAMIQGELNGKALYSSGASIYMEYELQNLIDMLDNSKEMDIREELTEEDLTLLESKGRRRIAHPESLIRQIENITVSGAVSERVVEKNESLNDSKSVVVTEVVRESSIFKNRRKQ